MSDSETNCCRWLLTGRVQGVGFRWYVHLAARGLGLAGQVRNLADGTVEVIACGPAADLDDLEARLRQGPPGARVRGLHREPAVATADEGFRIAH